MTYSNKNKVIIVGVLLLLCVATVYLTTNKPNDVSFSKLNTEATVQIGDTFTVVLDDGAQNYKWNMVHSPKNSRLMLWEHIIYPHSVNYHPGTCKYTFRANFPGEETISFVFSKSYYHNATDTFNITVTTV